MNLEDGKYYVFSPIYFMGCMGPGTYSVPWGQWTAFPFEREYYEAAFGIGITEQDAWTQVPPGTYMVEWYGATCYFAIGHTDPGFIDELPDDAFAPGGKSALEGKSNAAENMMEAGNYAGALKKLEDDILPFIEKKVLDPAVKAALQGYAYYLIGVCEDNL